MPGAWVRVELAKTVGTLAAGAVARVRRIQASKSVPENAAPA